MPESGVMTLRAAARHIFDETLQRTRVGHALRETIAYDDGDFCVGKQRFTVGALQSLVVISIGKAALPAAEAVLAICEGGPLRMAGIVVGPSVPDQRDSRLLYFAGGHPLPTQGSLEAATAILDLLSQCADDSLVLVLLSGGASSMVESALDPELSLEEIACFHQALVHSGLPITEMNTLRKHFSRVKGGRLAVAAGGAAICTVIVSDVPPGRLHVVGSGPTLPDPSTLEDCRRIVEKAGAALPLSSKVQACFAEESLAETPKANHPAFRKAFYLEVLSSTDLCTQAASAASELGFEVTIDNTCDEWDYAAAAIYLITRLNELREQRSQRSSRVPLCLISAGEVSVKVQSPHGLGGRNQQFVLECARAAAERGVCMTVLSAGSDGVDGNCPAAGALADEQTSARAARLGLSLDQALEYFNSYPLLKALNDTIETGPTGNNLRDLRLLLALS